MHYLVQNKREPSPTVGWILCKRPAMMFWSQKSKGAKIPTVQWHFFQIKLSNGNFACKVTHCLQEQKLMKHIVYKIWKEDNRWKFLCTMALGGKFCISAHGCTLCKHTLPQLFCCEGFEFVFILLFQCWLIFFGKDKTFSFKYMDFWSTRLREYLGIFISWHDIVGELKSQASKIS